MTGRAPRSEAPQLALVTGKSEPEPIVDTLRIPEPAAPLLPAPEKRFDWFHDDTVIIHHQPATAVYGNAHDQVVIRQESPHAHDEDSFVFFSRSELPRLISALKVWLKDDG